MVSSGVWLRLAGHDTGGGHTPPDRGLDVPAVLARCRVAGFAEEERCLLALLARTTEKNVIMMACGDYS